MHEPLYQTHTRDRGGRRSTSNMIGPDSLRYAIANPT